MLPMPMPAPMRAKQAKPAPMNLAAVGSIYSLPSEVTELKMNSPREWGMDSVVHVHCVVEVDAGENREDERLQERDHELESRKGDREQQRRKSENPEADDEAGENLQHRVAGHHVGEETHREADWANEVRDQLDRHDQWHEP